MTIKTAVTPGTAAGPDERRGVAANVVRPRRSLLFIVTGALLVVVLALASMWVQLRSDRAVEVLAVARPVAAGQVIGAADLRVATVVPDPAVRLVAASKVSSVVGRAAAVPLVAGALLSPEQVGPAAWPASGEAVVALPLKPGRIPAGITPGARVRVLTVAPVDAVGPAAGSDRRPGTLATVVEVGADVDASGTVVVSLLMRASEADAVAAAGGEATLVQLGPGG